MDMPDVVEMLKTRQGEKSVESYAHEMGVTVSTLYKYYNKDRRMNLEIVRRLARYFEEQGDREMVDALGRYALGLDSNSKDAISTTN